MDTNWTWTCLTQFDKLMHDKTLMCFSQISFMQFCHGSLKNSTTTTGVYDLWKDSSSCSIGDPCCMGHVPSQTDKCRDNDTRWSKTFFFKIITMQLLSTQTKKNCWRQQHLLVSFCLLCPGMNLATSAFVSTSFGGILRSDQANHIQSQEWPNVDPQARKTRVPPSLVFPLLLVSSICVMHGTSNSDSIWLWHGFCRNVSQFLPLLAFSSTTLCWKMNKQDIGRASGCAALWRCGPARMDLISAGWDAHLKSKCPLQAQHGECANGAVRSSLPSAGTRQLFCGWWASWCHHFDPKDFPCPEWIKAFRDWWHDQTLTRQNDGTLIESIPAMGKYDLNDHVASKTVLLFSSSYRIDQQPISKTSFRLPTSLALALVTATSAVRKKY